MKLEPTELEQIQAAREKFNQAKIMLGDIELNKQVVLSEIDVIKEEFKVLEDALIEKYGADSTINMTNGEVTTKDNQPLQKV
tara:strand:+ start:316 stop:561 length:246 start_codon:yes stop_codon:yes gene_type:complete